MADKMPQIVCVGRKYGSGGREIGEHLAERLGVPCYDKLLIKKTAAESGLSEDFIRQEEETPAQSRWFLSGNAFADSAALSEAFYSGSQMIYDAEQKVIRQLAEKGPCVIVGRNADYILKDRKDVLNVFLHADIPHRVERVLEANPDEKNPEGRIAARDKRRRLNYQHYTGRTWAMSQNYHICLDTSVLGYEQCAEIILNAVKKSKEG